MATIPKKVTERVVSGIKKYQPLLASTANQTHVDLVGIQSTGLVYLG